MLISVCISVMTGLWSMLSLKYIRLTIIANDRTQGCYFQKKRPRMLNNRIKINYSKCFDFVSQKDIIFMADDKPHIFQKNWLIFTLIDNWSFNLTESALFPILNCWINTSYFYRVKYYLVKFTSDFSHFFRVFILKKMARKFCLRNINNVNVLPKILYIFILFILL